MKIIERSPVNQKHKFCVLKNFFFNEVLQPAGIELEIDLPQVELDSLVKSGRVYPCDLLDGQKYVAIRKVTLPGRERKFECDPMDVIKLTASDGLRLMWSRDVVPLDDGRYRPYGLRLGGPPKDYRFQAAIDRADDDRFQTELKKKFRRE